MNIKEIIQKIDRDTAAKAMQLRKQGQLQVVIADDDMFSAVVTDKDIFFNYIALEDDQVVSCSCSCGTKKICRHLAALAFEMQERLEGEVSTDNTTEQSPGSYHFCGKDLTKMEMFILCMDAYCGSNFFYPISNIIEGKDKKDLISKKQQYVINQQLLQKGLVSEHKRSFYCTKEDAYFLPKEEYYMDVLLELLSNQQSWLKFFDERIDLDKTSEYILQVCKNFLGLSKKKATLRFYYAKEATRPFTILVHAIRKHDWEAKKLCNALGEDELLNVLNSLLHHSLIWEEPKLLDKVEECLAIMEQDSLWYDLHQCLCLYRFYFTGQPVPFKESTHQSPWIKYAEAITHLQQGNLDKAIACFDKALRTSKGKGYQRYFPQDPVTTYFYVVALGLRRNGEDIKVLSKMNDYDTEIKAAHNQGIFSLIKFFQSSFQPRETKYAMKDLTSSVPPMNRMIACIILHFFGLQKKYKGQLPTTKIALLRREAAPFGICPDEKWSYDPLLASFKVRPAWELELNDIIDNTSWLQTKKDSDESAATPSVRLVYLFSQYSLMEVRELTRLKNGKWSKGRKMSDKRYINADTTFDPIDKAIHTAWKMNEYSERYYFSLPSLALILPYLKDTDKALFREHPLSIREEKVFLYTTNNQGNITFGTNIPSHDKIRSEKELVIDQTSDDEWVYYKVDDNTKTLINRLKALGSIPSDAQPLLEKLFGVLQGKVEVHSDIAGATAIEQCQGQTRLTLRIVPEAELFRATLGLYPLEGGSRMVFPGEGDVRLFDAIEGKRFEVQRDIKAERRALKAFNTMLTEEGDLDLPFTARAPEQYLSLIELLNTLEMASQENAAFAIEWPEGEALRMHRAKAQSWDVAIKNKGGWFELEGEIPISEDHVLSMGQLLALMREGQSNRFVRLGPNEYLQLSDNLRRQLERINAMAQMKGNKVRLPELAVAVAGDSIQGELELNEPKRLLEMRRRIRQSDKLEISIPATLNATLRDYQEDGFRWMMRLMHWGAGACLADDMGLGKTVQTIACLLAHAQEGAQMVVAPASVVGNWQREVNRFAPSLRIVMLNELASADRQQALNSLGAGDLLILTYGLLVSESDALAAREWTTVCLDEAHTIKNRDTKSSAAAMRLQATNRIILTGTPIQNHLGELWNLMQFINPGLLGSYDHFTERFINPIDAGVEEPRLQLRRLISPFLLRRTKQEVARELPDKVEIQVPVSLSPDEMAIYEVLRREAKQELEQSSTLSMNALAMITKLREAACSAALVEKKWKGTSSKLEAMLDKLQQMLEEGNRVLIFSQFTSFLDMAQEVMREAGITDFYYLNGSTPMRQRQQMVEGFQRGDKRVFLISLKAGGLGLNLTGANYVIHLDPWWNPAIEQQATDRAYRIGQQQKVTVYHLIAEHTIEEKILRLHDTKRSLADSLLEGSDMSHKMTAEEMLALIEEA